MFIEFVILGIVVVSAIGFAAWIEWLKGEQVAEGFVILCLIVNISLISWVGVSVAQSVEYDTTQYGTGQVVNSFNPDKQVMSTIVYEVDGEVKALKLNGFVPAGVKIKIYPAKKWYNGIYYKHLPGKIEYLDESFVPAEVL